MQNLLIISYPNQQFPLPVEKQCLQVLSGCPWMFSIRWDRFGPLFSVPQLRFGCVGPRGFVRTKACPVRMSTDLGGMPAIRRRRTRCTMADGNQDRVVRNRGRVPHQRGLRTTVPSCGGSGARSHRASFPTGMHNCSADVGRLGSVGSTTAGSGPSETPASSGSASVFARYW